MSDYVLLEPEFSEDESVINPSFPENEVEVEPNFSEDEFAIDPNFSDDEVVFEVTLEQFLLMKGEKGDRGYGVILGGHTGQVLAKASESDLDMAWVDPYAGAVDHRNLLHRDAEDQHPMSAVTGVTEHVTNEDIHVTAELKRVISDAEIENL